VQRPQAANGECGDLLAVAEPVRIGVRDDEPTEDEEEVDEQPGVSDDRELEQMSVDVQVRQCDHESGHAAPAIESPKMHHPLSRRRQ
jgi:hypothetical protein